jgi:hypothetical protein
MFNWMEDTLLQRIPLSCRRALAPFQAADRETAQRLAWDHCKDAVALLWLAALRAPEKEGGERKVMEEIERAKARVLEPINDPSTDVGRRAEERLVNHLNQPRVMVDGSPKGMEKLADLSKNLDEGMTRELWVEYVRRMGDVVEGIRMNLRDIVVD